MQIYYSGDTYVFENLHNSSWVQISKISQDLSGYDYGHSVDLYSNLIIVGAPGDDSFGGIVYFYDIYNSSNNYDITSDIYEEYGMSVSMYNNIAIIGTSDNVNFIYQYEINNNTNSKYTWNQIATLSVSEANDSSPVSTGLSCSEIVVGAPYDTINQRSNAGSAYIFDITPSDGINNNTSQCSVTNYSWINSFDYNIPTTTSGHIYTTTDQMIANNTDGSGFANTTAKKDSYTNTNHKLESQLELIAIILSIAIVGLFCVSFVASYVVYYFATCACACGIKDKMIVGVDKARGLRLFVFFLNTLDFWLDAIFAGIVFVSYSDEDVNSTDYKLFTIPLAFWLLIFTVIPHLLSSVICLFVIVSWRRKDERLHTYLTRYEIFIFVSSLVSRFYASMSLFQSKIFFADLFYLSLKKMENNQLKRLQLINVVILEVYFTFYL